MRPGLQLKLETTTDWLACEDIEVIPGKMNGCPVIKGTRMEPDTIVDNFEAGSPIEEVHENYPHIPLDTIRRILALHRTITIS